MRQLQQVDFRSSDVRHPLANATKAAILLGYQPTYGIGDGLVRPAAGAIVDNYA